MIPFSLCVAKKRVQTIAKQKNQIKSAPPLSWYREVEGGVGISVKVIPRAKNNSIVGVENNALKIRVTAAPVDDAANKAVVSLLSKALKLPKRSINIQRGSHSRSKELTIYFAPREMLIKRLLKLTRT